MSTFKPAKPIPFSGNKRDHAEVEAFIQSCQLHYRLTKTTDEEIKVYGAISFFEPGSAAQHWAGPFLYAGAGSAR
jgi:hypothetical protein